jgi:DNA-binding Lrp family transcriptional regulator
MDKIRTGWQREFFQAPNEIYDRRDISGYAKAVFVYLCRRADDESRAFPTYARIAEDVGFSLSTVRRGIEALVETGLLIKEARYDRRGFQTSNIYTLIRPSSVPEREDDLPVEGKKDDEAKPELSQLPESEQGALSEQPGCSEGASGVLSENSPDSQADQPGCSVGTGRMSPENNKKDPDYKYPDEQYPKEKDSGDKDPSVRQSVNPVRETFKEKRLTEGQIDFSDFQQVIQYYMDNFSATRSQVLKALISVQDQLYKGTIIMDYKAYFEKTLTQVMQEEDFRKHFV